MGSGYSKKYSNTFGSIAKKFGEEKNKQSESSSSQSALDPMGFYERMTMRGSRRGATIEGNAKLLKERYPLSESGYFFKRKKGKRVCVSESSDPVAAARTFYEGLSAGGKTRLLDDECKGVRTDFSDGTVSYREISSSDGSPAVQITIKGGSWIKSQKIHFVKGE